MASYGLYTLLTATGTATGTELTTGNNDQRTFQAVCTGTGAVTATAIPFHCDTAAQADLDIVANGDVGSNDGNLGFVIHYL